MGERLFEAGAEPKAFYAIEGAEHNDTWVIGGRKYFETLKQFIQS